MAEITVGTAPANLVRLHNKGKVVEAFRAVSVTTTSEEINCVGYNAILVHAILNGECNWTFKVQGCTTSGGTFVDCYELANTGTMTLMSYQTNASKIFVFKGIPDYIKIVGTEDVNGTSASVYVQPINL